MQHTIAIVDDHVLIAKALTGIIENFKQFTVLYKCEHGLALQEKFTTKNNIPDRRNCNVVGKLSFIVLDK